MKHLRIVAKGFENYSSILGGIQFKDGISVDPLPRSIADRISGGIQMVEINDDGTETPAGVAHRLVASTAQRAALAVPLARQTEAEDIAEALSDAMKAEKPPVSRYYTLEELNELASKEGINGLRVISKGWGVKHRSIPVLIQMILQAQSAFLSKRDIRMQKASDRIEAAKIEAEAQTEAARAAYVAAQKKADDEAATLVVGEGFAENWVINGAPATIAEIAAHAHSLTPLTLTGWNNQRDSDRAVLIQKSIEILGATVAEEKKAESKQPDLFEKATEEDSSKEKTSTDEGSEETPQSDASGSDGVSGE